MINEEMPIENSVPNSLATWHTLSKESNRLECLK